MKDEFDLKRLREFFERGMIISRTTWAGLLAHAEFLTMALDAQGTLCNKYRDFAMKEPQAVAAPDRSNFIERILLGVAEIPDRDSPEDQPEMMLVTSAELRGIIESAFEVDDEQASQPIAAPKFDQAEFDEMVRKGTAAWGDTPAPRDEPIAAPADPMDWKLPCDVKVGCGTHGKGTSLRSLVGRMQRLYDEVVAASPVPEGGLDSFVAASQQPVPAPHIDSPEFHKCVMSMRDAYGAWPQDKYRALDAHIDTWVAQLVQQQATLSDEQIDAVADKFKTSLRGWEWSGEIIEVNGYKEYEFARAILAAAGAK